MKKIEITISPDGQSKVETKGFEGGECLSASKPYEKALGLVSSDEKTAEYFSTSENENELQAGN